MSLLNLFRSLQRRSPRRLISNTSFRLRRASLSLIGAVAFFSLSAAAQTRPAEAPTGKALARGNEAVEPIAQDEASTKEQDVPPLDEQTDSEKSEAVDLSPAGIEPSQESDNEPRENGAADESPVTEPTPPNYEARETDLGEKPSGGAAQIGAEGVETRDSEDDYAGVSPARADSSDSARKKFVFSVALDMTVPLGAVRDFVSSTSLQGFSLDVHYFVWDNVAVGLGVAFDSLSEKSEGTLEWKNATVTGTQVKDVSIVPVLAKGYYSWRDTEKFVPYIALGAGGNRLVKRVNAGFSSLSEAQWQFTLVPEIGVHVPVGRTVLMASGRFNYLAAGGRADQAMFANLSVGIAVQ